MTAPTIDKPVTDPAALPSDIPAGAHAIRLPVMAIEGMDTADGRYLEPGGITHQALPIPLLAQVRNPDGGDGHDAAWIVGAVTEMTRIPGPQVISKQTGKPFPEGTFVWEGTRAWMYDDVPAPPMKSAYTLVKDRALSGNSVDLSAMTVQLEYDPADDPDDPEAQPVRRAISASIGATTLVPMPAFPDAYVEIDGELMVPEGGQTITASSVSWRSAELDDNCAPCSAGLSLAEEPPADAEPEDDAPRPVHRGGMVALVPADPASLAVEGGDPAEELHLTLAYLGDDVSVLSEDQRAAVHSLAQQLARHGGTSDGGYASARVFGHASFNPDGGTDGDVDPCAVYLIGDAEMVSSLRDTTVMGLKEALGADLPTQYDPFVPHITAGYGVSVADLSATGPVQFDRVRVALAGEVTDYPIGEEEGEGAQPIVAAAIPVFPAAAFAVPEPDQYTPPYITEPDEAGNRYYRGHVAQWGSCHTGFTNQCRLAPRSPSGYAYYHTGLTRTENGDLATGVVTFNLPDQRHGGHAPIRLNAQQAAAHYDNTACAAADVRAVDGRFGIWVCGVVRSTLTSEQLHAFRASGPSGDWRPVRGQLEMVGVHNVNSQGYVSVRTMVASGRVVALVAAGATATETLVAGAARLGREDRELLDWARTARAREQQAAAMAELEALGGMSPQDALGWLQAEAESALLLAAEGGFNWVEDAGGLPSYIHRIKKHLQEKGMDESRAIATAVNAAKKMCSTGDTSLPGKQEINPGSQAEACEAVAEWEAKRAKSKAD